MTVYYISGPMRGKTDYNRDLFNRAEEDLSRITSDDDIVINPSRNFNGNQSLAPNTYLTLDFKQLLDADVIVQLPGWQASEGATREAYLGLWTGKRFMLAEYDSGSNGTAAGPHVFRETDGPEFSASPRVSVIDEARQLITGDRNNAYGPPTQDFMRTAALASAFGFQVNGKPVRSYQVAIFMELLKISRLAWTPGKRDSWADTIGYAACGYECAVTEEAGRTVT
ncbi:MAG TPA: DUF6378 domain-containing protein [Geobacteraceae bacterium]|nr:DUF6378 domain-containing protein [Geobacteraceae bacterium]